MNKITQAAGNAAALAVGAVTISQLHAIAKMEEVSASLDFANILPDDLQESILKDRKKQAKLQTWLCLVPAFPFGFLISAILCFLVFNPDEEVVSRFTLTLILAIMPALMWFAVTCITCNIVKRKAPWCIYYRYFEKNIWPAFAIPEEDEKYWSERINEWTTELYVILSKPSKKENKLCT